MKWSNWLTTSVSGEISEDITFLHKTFPVPPSMRAIIHVDVSYPERMQEYYPMMGVYTTPDHINIKNQCTRIEYGQLGNKNLHPGLTSDQNVSTPLKCDTTRRDKLHCVGIITVEDFIPRQFSFSFGFHYDEITATSSLRGLVYKINLYTTNETNCYDLLQEDECFPYVQRGVNLNLLDLENYDLEEPLKIPCYQHLLKLFCYMKTPKCDSATKQVILPCREMCHD